MQNLMLEEKKFVFLAGLHRSGTSLLHEIIREHPDITGFHKTGVSEDEGQHLQSVYKAAKVFGGPGRFAFNENAYMNEFHPLATQENAAKIFLQWSQYLDLECSYIVEKSPPNLIRTRFFQKIFPQTKFVVILRHPVAISLATQKWSKTSLHSLLEHTLKAYEIFYNDMCFLNKICILRYEDFVSDPKYFSEKIFNFIGVESVPLIHEVKKDVNQKYFSIWNQGETKKEQNFDKDIIIDLFEEKFNKFGYSIADYNKRLHVSWLLESTV